MKKEEILVENFLFFVFYIPYSFSHLFIPPPFETKWFQPESDSF
ncbi:hypothetical protein BOVA604_2195 [Bacteroides ovatus]|nr:hypothetical protein BOVA604_2195 [Bacteroides ovatus]